MKISQLQEMEETLSFPTYVFQHWISGYSCDKIWKDGDKKIQRRRYLMVAGASCTCLGYIKKESCKHLKMLRGDDSWVRDGAPAWQVVEVAEKLSRVLLAKNEDKAKKFEIDIDTLPDIVKVLDIGGVPDSKQPYRLACLKKLDSGDLGVVITSEKFLVPQTE